MIDEEEQISDSLHQKLPPQHWVLRYSSLLVAGLITMILIGLYWIKIPQFINIELHPIANTDQFKAITLIGHQPLLQEGKTIKVQLENGHSTTFQIQATQARGAYLHLQLHPLELHQKQQEFLQQEYMSIGKIKKETRPLIYSLINT